MNQILELSDKNFNFTMIKILKKLITNSFATNESRKFYERQ